MLKDNSFILAGNGPYENRGCEAIVRGTCVILRNYFSNPRFSTFSNFLNDEQYARQAAAESDPSMAHKKIHHIFDPKQKFKPKWWVQTLSRRLFPPLGSFLTFRDMLKELPGARAVLSIGGDNYSLDYGVPKLFVDLDNQVLRAGKKLIIWGASVGPFSKNPEFEKIMIRHLQKVHIFARESSTVEYLNSKGLNSNVYRVADPAFLMEAVEPSPEKLGVKIEPESIGINLSPLMAKYLTHGDYKTWVEKAAGMVKEIAEKSHRQIYLIPHVTSAHTDDYSFLKDVLACMDKTLYPIELVPPMLNAAELKWVIGKMKLFIGARTHSTIAAMSSEVPTISLAYSVKARGINQDVFGHCEFCIEPKDILNGTMIEKIQTLLKNSADIKNNLNLSLQKIRVLAMDSGKYLKEILGE